LKQTPTDSLAQILSVSELEMGHIHFVSVIHNDILSLWNTSVH